MQRKIIFLLILLGLIYSQSFGQFKDVSRFRVDPNGFFTERQKPGQSNYYPFFMIGMNVGYWAQDTTSDTDYPAELAFTSAKEIFNGLVLRWVESNDPTYLTLHGSDCVFLGGSGYLNWSLYSDPRFRACTTYTDRLGPLDQSNLFSNIYNLSSSDPKYPDSLMKYLWDTYTNPGTKRGDFIHFLIDEPEHGSPHSWYFHNNVLNRYYDSRPYPGESIVYLDLGPISGNNKIFSDIIGSDNIFNTPKGNCLYHYDETATFYNNGSIDYEANVHDAANYYKDACDVMG